MKIKKENIMNRFLKMNRFFKSCLIGSAGLILLAVTLSFTAPGRAVAQAAEDCIRICNTASNPLHVLVQGITRISGEVKINNENAIATTVTGPVQVSTSRGEPLFVTRRLKMDDIFQKSVSLDMANGQSEVSTTFVVPAGKFVVIESAFGVAQTNSIIEGCGNWCWTVDIESQHPSVRIKTNTNNNASQHSLATVHSSVPHITNDKTPPNPYGVFWNVGGNTIQMYSGPGTEIEVIFNRPNTERGKRGSASLDLTLSGHYEDVN